MYRKAINNHANIYLEVNTVIKITGTIKTLGEIIFTFWYGISDENENFLFDENDNQIVAEVR